MMSGRQLSRTTIPIDFGMPDLLDRIFPASLSRRARTRLMLVLRVGVTLGLLGWVFRKTDVRAIAAVMWNCDWYWWAAGFGVGVIVQGIAAMRWAALARPIGFPFSIGTFVWRFFEGLFFNLCLPSSIGGDVVKAYRLADSTPSRLLAGCTVLADRLTGLAALGVLAGTALLSKKFALPTLPTTAVGAGLFVAVATMFWIAVSSLDKLLELIPEQHAARAFLGRLLPYQRQPGLMTKALGWSMVVQMGGAVTVALIARAIGVFLPMSVWFAVAPLVTLMTVLPISIAGVGIREEAMQFLLRPDVLPEQAVAIGIMWFLSAAVTGLIGAVLFLCDRGAITDVPATGADGNR
jgi:uncharacterized membrane protein YbhN (UPF0104 family)